MALLFTAASSQYLTCAAPTITDYPFSVGMWVRLTAAADAQRTLFALSDTGSTGNYLALGMTTAEAAQVAAAAGGGQTNANIGTLVAGVWAFILTRFVSATDRRASVVDATSSVTTSSSTSRAPTGMDMVTFGALKTSSAAAQFWDGAIAEAWIADGDVYPSEGQNTTRHAVLDLAYRGPFANPFLRDRVIEYRSFLQGIVSPGDLTRMQFTEVNGPIPVTDHPPLLPGYRRAAAKYAPLTV